MKRLIYIIIFIALAALLMLRFCAGIPSLETQQPKDFDINGVWVHTHTQHLDSAGKVRSEYDESGLMYKLYADGYVYKYIKHFPSGEEPYFAPYTMEHYLLMPEADTLYAEGEIVIPITEMHDSVLNIRWQKTIQHWRRVTNVSQTEQEEMAINSKLKLRSGSLNTNHEDLYSWYISTHRELLTQHRNLMLCLLLLFIGSCTMLWFYRRNRRLSAALADLQEEIQERPEAIRETTRQLSDELYASDWYLDLKRRAADGGAAHFSPDDWAEIERQVRRLHPTFRGRLYSLYAFSETEYRVCLLLKLHFTPTEIATALCKDKSTVSTIRGRLYAKVFGTKGSSKAWDEFIEQI